MLFFNKFFLFNSVIFYLYYFINFQILNLHFHL